MSLSGSESNEHLSGEPIHGFVTVIPLDYTRHRGFLQPPDQYRKWHLPVDKNLTIDKNVTLGIVLKNSNVFCCEKIACDYKSREERDNERVDCLPCGKYMQIEDITLGYKAIGNYENRTEWDNIPKLNTITDPAPNTYEPHHQSMKVCVYMMIDVALRMEVDDGGNTNVQELINSIALEEQLRLPRIASTMFSLWMTSGLLELQLKPHHKPLHIRSKWPMLLTKYAHASESRQRRDEPILCFKRNVFFPLSQEERIKDEKVLELLYAEAKYNILEGRYPCDIAQYIMLGSIQARIELGPYNPQYHTLHFFREQQNRFLPSHIRNKSWNSWLMLNGKDSPEVRLLENYRRLPDRKLHKKYLEFCWSLPYYGSAFFQGQIEQPVRGLKSLITHQDIPVLVGINGRGVFVINNAQCTLLVGLRYEELSWDFAKPSQEDNPDCLPCLFLQFRVVENGTKVSKILQIFSKQAVMMDALITGFVEELKLKLNSNPTGTSMPTNTIERTASLFDGSVITDGSAASRKDSSTNFLMNKLRKLTLATFDEEGIRLSSL